jgi:uncharacterized membrane protein YfcA
MFSALTYFVVGLLAIGSGFLTASIGFGGAVFMMLFFPSFLPFLQASSLASTIVYVGILMLAWQYRKYVLWRQVWLPAFLYILTSVPVVFFVSKIDLEHLELFFSIFLIVLGCYNLSSVLIRGAIRLPHNLSVTIICSVLSGLGTGLFGIGGPPMALYFLSIAGDDKNAYIGTLQLFFSICMFFTISARFASGIMTQALIPLALMGTVASLLGNFLGAKALAHINVKAMKLAVCVFMIFSGTISAFRNI